MEKKIEELTVVELESLAYRQIVLLEQCQNNIRILREEIQRRNAAKEST